MAGDVCAQVLEDVKAERRYELSQLVGKDAFYDMRREGVSAATGCRGEVRHPAKIKIPALLVYGSVFGVAPRVTYNEYAPLGAP